MRLALLPQLPMSFHPKQTAAVALSYAELSKPGTKKSEPVDCWVKSSDLTPEDREYFEKLRKATNLTPQEFISLAVRAFQQNPELVIEALLCKGKNLPFHAQGALSTLRESSAKKASHSQKPLLEMLTALKETNFSIPEETEKLLLKAEQFLFETHPDLSLSDKKKKALILHINGEKTHFIANVVGWSYDTASRSELPKLRGLFIERGGRNQLIQFLRNLPEHSS